MGSRDGQDVTGSEASVDGIRFDHARLDFARYNDLEGVDDVASFSEMVVDYMRYLRDDPASYAEWDEEIEMRAAQQFVYMVNNEIGWSLARCKVPEFQVPVTDTTLLPDPLRYILDAVEARLPHNLTRNEPPVAGDEQLWEENLVFRQQCRLIEYVGWRAQQVGGGGGADERRVEVDNAISTLRAARAVVREAQEQVQVEEVQERVEEGETEENGI